MKNRLVFEVEKGGERQEKGRGKAKKRQEEGRKKVGERQRKAEERQREGRGKTNGRKEQGRRKVEGIMKLLILVLIFGVIFFLVISLYYLEMARRASKKEKFLKKLAVEGRRKAKDSQLNEENKKGALELILAWVMDLVVIENLLVSSDASISVGRFLSISLGMGLVFLVLPMVLMKNPFVMLIFLVFGSFVPTIYYILKRKKREEIMVKQLPEAINMITRALKAGQPLDAALHEVGRSLAPPVGSEISTVYDEMAMGLPFETAIRNFEKRYPRISDIKILCTTFVVQRETGGNLSAILEGLANTIRERFKLQMQVRALTAEGRMTSLILGFIPIGFATMTWFLNPKYISILFTHPLGKKLLLLAFFLEAVGFYVMRKLSSLEV